MYNDIKSFIRSIYGEGFIPLHAPLFNGNEKKYLLDCIDSTFVSSVGKYVDKMEEMLCDYTKSKYAIATVNGTAALHTALVLADVKSGDEVLTQALTFVATANAIKYQNANPVFIDSSEDNLGLCPKTLKKFLDENAELRSDGYSYNKLTGNRIKACVPMHVFGHPVDLDPIIEICEKFNIVLIEDAAESLGSYYKNKHTGTIARIGILSFNGNKVITSGGGGAILVQDEALAKRAKHITTTGKVPHRWEFDHDCLAFNYRMPNINAALLCAQIEELDNFIQNKRKTAESYIECFEKSEFKFIKEPSNSKSNYWLNAIQCKNLVERDEVLTELNDAGLMARPIWKLMTDLELYSNCQRTKMDNARKYANTIINIPSSVKL